MSRLRCLVAMALVAAMSATPTSGQSLTSLLTQQERAAAGLSKLTVSEIAALDAAMFRVLAALLAPDRTVSPSPGAGSDLDLFDSRGQAVAFLSASDDLTLYLWSGQPVAYIDGESVYGFNGKHLGWYREAAIYDQDGDLIAAPASRFRGAVSPSSPRGLRGLRPLKGLKELKPLKPLFGLSWSRTPAQVFFLQGVR